MTSGRAQFRSLLHDVQGEVEFILAKTRQHLYKTPEGKQAMKEGFNLAIRKLIKARKLLRDGVWGK